MLKMIRALIESKKNSERDESIIVESVTDNFDESLIIDEFMEDAEDTAELYTTLEEDGNEDLNDISTEKEFDDNVEEVSDNDLLSIEIDLTSNTPIDVLPVPPSGAADAVADDDITSQRIDSGFGGDDEPSLDNPMGSPEEPIEDDSDEDDISNMEIDDKSDEKDDTKEDNDKDDDNILNDEIEDEKEKDDEKEDKEESVEDDYEESSLFNLDLSEEEDDTDLLTEAIVTDDQPAEAEETDPPIDEEESPVTTAVKDKVAEAAPDGEDDMMSDDTEIIDNEDEEAKKNIFNKLSTLSKQTEDIKKDVVDLLNK